MFALINAPQDAVTRTLTPAGLGVIGPTSPTGWTPAWLPDEARLDGVGDRLLIVEGTDGTRVHLLGDAPSIDLGWLLTDPEHHDFFDGAAADIALHLSTPQRLAEIRESIGQAEDFDDLVDGLSALLGVTEPHGPVPTREVVVHHGKPFEALMAARMAAHAVGPIGLAALEDGWSVAKPVTAGTCEQALAEAVVALSSKRGSTILTLWRDVHGGSGFELLSNDGEIATGRWNTPWVILEEDWVERDAESRILCDRMEIRPDNVPALRALMRARTRQLDPLAELVALLEMPPAVLDILDQRVEPDEVKPARLRQLIGAAIVDSYRGPVIKARWAQLAIAVVALVLAVVSMVFAVFLIAVIVTNGALVDAAGVNKWDWVPVAFAVLAAAINLCAGINMIRHGTFF